MSKYLDYMEYSEFCGKLFAPLPPLENFIHAALGVVTEVGELAELREHQILAGSFTHFELKTKEEVGDLMFYITRIFDVAELDFAGAMRHHTLPIEIPGYIRSVDHCLAQMFIEATVIADQAKRMLAYDKPMDLDKVRDASRRLLTYLRYFCKIHGFTIEQAIEMNMAKLTARYGEKFSAEAAINRDTAAEYAAMQA